jgi:hypothetical protein
MFNEANIKHLLDQTKLEELEASIKLSINLNSDEGPIQMTKFLFRSITPEVIRFQMMIGGKLFKCSITWQVLISRLILNPVHLN